MKKRWVVPVVFLGIYIGLFGDLHLSKYLFKKYCNDGRTGLFIYEKVGLGEEYFIPFNKEKYPPSIPKNFVFDGMMVDESHLRKNFELNNRYVKNQKKLSIWGPIYSHKTTVVRKSDGKVLSKAVSLTNRYGWGARFLSSAFPSWDSCPLVIDDNGSVLPNSDHSDAIRKVFYKM